MGTDISRAQIRKNLQGKKIGIKIGDKITKYELGKKSIDKANKEVEKHLSKITGTARKKYYRKVGLTFEEKKKIEGIINPKKKERVLSNAQIKQKKRVNVRAGRISAGGSSLANNLTKRRKDLNENNRKANRSNERIQNALEQDGMKTGADVIGAGKKEKYTGTFLLDKEATSKRGVISQQGSIGHKGYAGQNNDGGISTIKNTTAKSVAGGFGTKKSIPSTGGVIRKGGGGNALLPK